MLCTLLVGESHRLLHTVSSLNRSLHESRGSRLQGFSTAFSGGPRLLCIWEEDDRTLPFCTAAFAFPDSEQICAKGIFGPYPIPKWHRSKAKLMLLSKHYIWEVCIWSINTIIIYDKNNINTILIYYSCTWLLFAPLNRLHVLAELLCI